MPEKLPDDDAQEIVVYAGPGVELSLPIDRERETVWATQAQITEVFGVERSGVSYHINRVFRDAEVDKESNSVKILHRNTAGPGRPETYYSLDVILAVGYRVNSGRAIQFRRWASGVLNDYIVSGVALNERRLASIHRDGDERRRIGQEFRDWNTFGGVSHNWLTRGRVDPHFQPSL